MVRLRRIDSGLVEAARQHFGGWLQALRAAGLKVKAHRQWSRQNVIAAIRAHHRRGTVWKVWKIDRTLFDAGFRYFGTWKKAIRAAGFTPRCLPWSRERVLRELRARYRRSQHNLGRVNPRLADTARRYFGSRAEAYRAAGLSTRSCQWTGERIVETIRDCYRRGLPAERSGFGDIPLQRAARRRYGTWRAALAAAGIDLGGNGP